MASDATSVDKTHSDDRAAARTRRKAQDQLSDLQELEKRVRIAELRAREVEAEVRYMEASAKRRELKSGKRGKDKNKNKEKNKDRKRDRAAESED